MKKGYSEKPGVCYGWVMVNGGGYIIPDVFRTRSAAIQKIEEQWNTPWRTIRRRYNLTIRFVMIVLVDDKPK